MTASTVPEGRSPSAGAEDGSAPPGELVEERRVGGSPQGWAANAALVALARAARSFRLYDPDNEAIRQFLESYREMTRIFLEAYGDLDLEVRPFELVLVGEVVYVERDRESSLAFRLYRDGVRRVQIGAATTWEELLHFLECLSIRFANVALAEEDLVTMVHRVGLRNIRIVAVEGFVADEEDSDDEPASSESTAPRMEVPHDWDVGDLPREGEAPLNWRPIAETWYDAIQAEVSPDRVVLEALGIAIEMLRTAADQTDPTSVSDVAEFVAEVRDQLATTGQVDLLIKLVKALRVLYPSHPDDVRPLLAEIGRPEALGPLIRSVPVGDESSLSEVESLLLLIPGDHTASVVALLSTDPDPGIRWPACQYLARTAPREASRLLAGLRDANPDVVRALLAALARALPDGGLELALKAVDHGHPGIQLEALRIVQQAPWSVNVSRALLRLLQSTDREVRIRAVDLLSEHPDARVFDAIVQYIANRATADLESAEAEALGQALGRLDRTRADAQFAEWIRPRSIFKRFVEPPGQKMLQWAAASGLEHAADDGADELLRHLAARAGKDLHDHCMATVARRHRKAKRD